MIITSKFRQFFLFCLGALLFFLAFLLLMLFLVYTRYPHVHEHMHQAARLHSNNGVILLKITFPLCAILIIALLLKEPMNITIDTTEKTITFQNIFTRSSKTYSLHFFDGYIDTFVVGRYGSYKMYFLVKDKKFVEKVKGYYYTNNDELADGLQSMPYLGFYKLGFSKTIKWLFNQPVLD